MESVTIIFSMFRLVFVEILSYGVRYTLIIAKMCVVLRLSWHSVVELYIYIHFKFNEKMRQAAQRHIDVGTFINAGWFAKSSSPLLKSIRFRSDNTDVGC